MAENLQWIIPCSSVCSSSEIESRMGEKPLRNWSSLVICKTTPCIHIWSIYNLSTKCSTRLVIRSTSGLTIQSNLCRQFLKFANFGKGSGLEETRFENRRIIKADQAVDANIVYFTLLCEREQWFCQLKCGNATFYTQGDNNRIEWPTPIDNLWDRQKRIYVVLQELWYTTAWNDLTADEEWEVDAMPMHHAIFNTPKKRYDWLG